MYKQLRLCNYLYIKKQHDFILRNDELYFIYTFQIEIEKSIDKEFFLFHMLLKKHSIQYLTIEL